MALQSQKERENLLHATTTRAGSSWQKLCISILKHDYVEKKSWYQSGTSKVFTAGQELFTRRLEEVETALLP